MQCSLKLHVHDNLRRTCKAAISATDTDRGRFESPSRRLLETIRQLFTILPFIVFLYRVRVVWLFLSQKLNYRGGTVKNALYVVFKKDLPHEVFAQDCGYLLGGPPRPLGGRRHHSLRGLISWQIMIIFEYEIWEHFEGVFWIWSLRRIFRSSLLAFVVQERRK